MFSKNLIYRTFFTMYDKSFRIDFSISRLISQLIIRTHFRYSYSYSPREVLTPLFVDDF
jgi:hypothetical protein